MLNKKALAATAAAQALYVEDVFSTYLWQGTGSAQTITNGVDLSTEGGLVWIKPRSGTYGSYNHLWADTVRGSSNYIYSDLNVGSQTDTGRITAFNTNGFSLGTDNYANNSGTTYASWTFRKAEKFFDVVTYTGNGLNRTIAHNLGSVPGCIIIKCYSHTKDWQVYHRANTANPETDYLVLNSTAATVDSDTRWNDTLPTSTEFSIGTDTTVNNDGMSYVAYLFAHDAGGFGDSGSESVIKCGSYSGTGSTGNAVSLGWEPQLVFIKRTDTTGNWYIFDNMRGGYLRPNTSGAETGGTSWFNVSGDNLFPTATGFQLNTTGADFNASGGTYIYIAIRRGPMKTPETGSSVFEPFVDRTSIANKTNGTMGPVDLTMQTQVSDPLAGYHWTTFDRLRGANKYINTSETSAETSATSVSFDTNTGVKNATWFSAGGVGYNFKRAPGFFDVVCYTGDASTTARPHNLGVAPQLMIIKQRNDGAISWYVYAEPLGNNKYLILDSTNGQATASFWNNQTPTATNFYIRSSGWPNEVGGNYVAYLFASAAGVSKVGSYTGNGSSQTINCGFAGGARFVLIKETTNASSGSWVVFDSARGIVSGNDPYLLLNSTAAEVTDKDAVDTDSTGFIVNETTGPNVNTNSSTYIFLAIA